MGYIVEQYAEGKAGFAFTGDRNAIWHRLGEQMKPGQSIEEWAKAAKLDFEVTKSPAFAQVDAVTAGQVEMVETGRYFITRKDNRAVLSPGVVSDQYQLADLQPVDVLRFTARYVGVDKRFALDAAGCLDGGARIWATATFNGDLKVAGERHIARLLMSTTYDATACSVAKCTVVRPVCDNTLAAALGDGRTEIKVRHNTKFNPDRVAKDLASMAKGVERFKVMGDAMAAFEMSKDQMSKFFRECLDIPFDVKVEDVSTRKLNQFHALNDAYKTSVGEGAPKLSSWAALQALTRYVDHERSTRNAGSNETAKRFQSSQWGSGDALKSRGMEILQGILKDAGKLPELV